MYQQFVDDLPEDFEEFVEKYLTLFPHNYDTKCMATTLGLFNKTDLNSMAQNFSSNKKFKNYLDFEYDLNAHFNKYLSNNKLHEAGYDSYLTGVCFGSMVKYLEGQNLIEYAKQNGRHPPTQEELNGGYINILPTTLASKRTDTIFEVPVPGVDQLNSIANSPMNLPSAIEFYNFIQIALDGVRYLRMVKDTNKKGQAKVQHEFPAQVVNDFDKTVMYVQLKKPPNNGLVSAYEIA